MVFTDHLTSIRKFKPNNYLALNQGAWVQTLRSSLGNLVFKKVTWSRTDLY